MRVNDLKEFYYYDDTSPTFLRWNKDIFSGRNGNQKNVSVGDVAGGLSPTSGYYQVRKERKLVLVHRIIWELFNGPIPDGMVIDHIDRDKLNNDITNLRMVTRTTNHQNMPKRCDNSSGKTGVHRLVNTNRSGSISKYWRATWYDGGVKSKAFSVNKYGEEGAYNLACSFRESKIEELNREGCSYTENHGK